jgi:hypothetical protein
VTRHRAQYLRRAIPLQGKPRCRVHRRTALVTDRCDVTAAPGLKPEYIDGRTYCPRCDSAKKASRGTMTLPNSYNAKDLTKLVARLGADYKIELAEPRDINGRGFWHRLFRR